MKLEGEDQVSYEEILKLYGDCCGDHPDLNDMLAMLIASHGEMMAFNEALDNHPEYCEIRGMSGLAELVLDKVIEQFDRIVMEVEQ
ncbi:MAG TPA: hypothetical protein DCX77_10605 [Acidimicrobiaceae bacterium]|nr:hypothetical protein [Acidimicrobiaceae bacterium]|tara:strand:+ start:4126 stop:4383 length:258 start_codon:yes stop_codon:yes gene_type:complete